ncbi:hypothetical protein L195_g033694, partial [Trifolium pratense]
MRVCGIERYQVDTGLAMGLLETEEMIATKDNLSRRGVIGQRSLQCVGESGLEESVSHLHFECPVFAGMWYRIGLIGHGRVFADQVSVIWFAGIWCIWKARNDKLFKNKE